MTPISLHDKCIRIPEHGVSCGHLDTRVVFLLAVLALVVAWVFFGCRWCLSRLKVLAAGALMPILHRRGEWHGVQPLSMENPHVCFIINFSTNSIRWAQVGMALGYVLVILMKFLVKISTWDLGIWIESHIVVFQDCGLMNLEYEWAKYTSTLVKVCLDIP
jgi:hypothetical protein